METPNLTHILSLFWIFVSPFSWVFSLPGALLFSFFFSRTKRESFLFSYIEPPSLVGTEARKEISP